MKIVNHLLPALLLTFALSIVGPVSGQVSTTTVAAPGELNLMPVPASVQLQAGRLPITQAFTVATKGPAEQRLRAGVVRSTRRLAGRTVLTLPLDLAVNENTATLVIQCDRGGASIPSLDEDESYSLEITDKQARLLAPSVVGALRGLETFLQLVQGDRAGYYLPGVKV